MDSSLLKSFYNYNLNRLGYQGIYKQRTNDKLDGCAIYFKKKKFNLVKQMTVELFKQSVHLLGKPLAWRKTIEFFAVSEPGF